MAWLYLLVAGAFEIVWAATLKMSEGFTRPLPTVVSFAAAGISLWLLAVAMRALPLGVSYAVFTGIGAGGAFLIGLLFFGEALTAGRLVSLGLIVAGILGLRMTTA